MFLLALNQGQQFAEAAGFKQKPKTLSFCGLLAISELRRCNGQFIRKKHLEKGKKSFACFWNSHWIENVIRYGYTFLICYF